MTFLPVTAEKLRSEAEKFMAGIVTGKLPDVQKVLKECGKFEPKIELKIFLQHISEYNKKLLMSSEGCEANVQLIQAVQNCYNNCSSYNQSTQQALECLIRDIARINVIYDRVLTKNA